MIDIFVLGRLDVRDRARNVSVTSVLAQPKRSAILCYLALATPRGHHRRERLLPLFWPESSEERARNSLNQGLFNLRRSLGEDAVVGTPLEIGLDRQVVWCDAVAFEDALASGDREAALALYGGNLLPGFHVDDCAEFEHWLEGERERLRRQALGAALSVATELEGRGNPVGAVEVLRRAATWAPYDEATVARLIELLSALGDRAGALREYARFRDLLATELALEPSADVEALAQRISAGGGGFRARPSDRRHADDDLGSAAPSAESPTRLLEGYGEGTHGSSNRRRVTGRSVAGGVAALGVVALVVWIAAGLGTATSSAHMTEPVLDDRRVLVAALENRTGDASLDPIGYMAADWIAQGLARTGLARAVPFSTVVQETPYLTAGQPGAEPLSSGGNRDLARRVGAGLLVAGSFYRTGDEIVFQAHASDVATGELLRAIAEVRASSNEPAAGIEELQRRTLGALATLFDDRLQSWPDPGAQPSSLEAYRLFSDGMSEFIRANRHWGSPEGARRNRGAAASFLAAAELDSAFTTSLLWAGYSYLNARDSASAHSVISALERQPLSPWSRAVLSHQIAVLARDSEAIYRAASALADMSPDSEWLFALGSSAYQTGRYRTSLDAFLRIDPERGWIRGFGSYWRLRSEVQHVLGNYQAALDDVHRGLAADPDDAWLRTQELWALAALGRVDEMVERAAPRLAATDAFALWQLGTAIEELRGHGHDAAVQPLVSRVAPLAEALAARNGTHGARSQLAYLLYASGRSSEALPLYRTLIAERPNDAELRTRFAALSARDGDHREAIEVLNWLATLHGEELARSAPAGQHMYWGSHEAWLALTQARLLAVLGESEEAIERLRAAIERRLSHWHLHLHDDPDFAVLRSHAGFVSLLRSRD